MEEFWKNFGKNSGRILERFLDSCDRSLIILNIHSEMILGRILGKVGTIHYIFLKENVNDFKKFKINLRIFLTYLNVFFHDSMFTKMILETLTFSVIVKISLIS